VVGRNHDAEFTVDRCEKHHQERHEQLRRAGVSLRREPRAEMNVATMLRALAVHKRAEANSEADALERWADTLEKSGTRKRK